MPRYVEEMAHYLRSFALDPVEFHERTGRPGLAARTREYLDHWLATR